MEIVYRKLDEMKKLDGNPRKITTEQLAKLKESIERNKDYFEARPLILSNRTGELVVWTVSAVTPEIVSLTAGADNYLLFFSHWAAQWA